MRLSKQIGNLFFDKLNIYDNESLVDSSSIQDKYLKIKSFLLKQKQLDNKIVILVKKDFNYVLFILVSLEIGITFVPLNKEWPSRRIIDILTDIGRYKVVTDDNFIGIPKCGQVTLLSIFESSYCNNNFDSSKIRLSSIAYIIFTSGSTGKPKGVTIKRGSYCNFVSWVDKYFRHISHNDKLLNTSDFSFDLSLIDIALFISRGVHFFISNFSGNVFILLSEIEKNKITTMATVPNNLQLLLSNNVMKRGNISSLSNLLIGGARFSYGLYVKINNITTNLNVYNLYGPTEATVYCSVKRLDFNEFDRVDSNISVGSSILGCNVIVTNKRSEILNYNEVGRVLVGGVQVMAGYLNNLKLTKDVLIRINGEIFYDTGDEGFLRDEKNLFIVGRSDDTIKVEGYRVNLSEIDSLLQQLSYVDECATVSLQDDIKENILVSFVRINGDFSKDNLWSDLSEYMPNYQIPKYIKFIEDLPLTSTGKISKEILRSYAKSEILKTN